MADPPQPTPPPADLVERGTWGAVRHAIRSDGTMEAKDWLDKVATTSERAKFDHLFRKIAATGQIRNLEHFRNLGNGIFEFKRDGNRILCFQQGRCWRLTHRYPKGGQKCPPSEIAHAMNIRAEFIERQEAEASNEQPRKNP
jgi:hypothetical protein